MIDAIAKKNEVNEKKTIWKSAKGYFARLLIRSPLAVSLLIQILSWSIDIPGMHNVL